MFGKKDNTTIDLSDIVAGIGGFVINGESSGDFSGISVSNAGDVNGDGLDDLIVGAQYASPTNKIHAGKSYVVFGKKDTDHIELSDIAAGIGGFVINGESANDVSGYSNTTYDLPTPYFMIRVATQSPMQAMSTAMA